MRMVGSLPRMSSALQQALDPPAGPVITFLGVTGADGKPTSPLGTVDGTPVYFRNTGSGFQLVVEARAGLSGQQPGVVTFNTNGRDPSRRPDIQIESSAPLGDGSLAVCDGGVPAINPPDFGPTQAVANALNDLACRFPAAATSPNSSCTQDSFGRAGFVGADTQTQLCLLVPRSLEVPTGQTTLSVRWRDTAGNPRSNAAADSPGRGRTGPPNLHLKSDPCGNAHADANRNADGDANADAHRDSRAHSNADTHCDDHAASNPTPRLHPQLPPQ